MANPYSITDGTMVCVLCGESLTGCALCGGAPLKKVECKNDDENDKELWLIERSIRKEAENRCKENE